MRALAIYRVYFIHNQIYITQSRKYSVMSVMLSHGKIKNENRFYINGLCYLKIQYKILLNNCSVQSTL